MAIWLKNNILDKNRIDSIIKLEGKLRIVIATIHLARGEPPFEPLFAPHKWGDFMNRKRPKQIVIRVSEEELDKIKLKVQRSNLKQSEYIIKCLLEKDIYVVEGLGELIKQVKYIGNNLNQLTRAVHEGKADCSNEVKEIQKELSEVWQLLRSLTQKQL